MYVCTAKDLLLQRRNMFFYMLCIIPGEQWSKFNHRLIILGDLRGEAVISTHHPVPYIVFAQDTTECHRGTLVDNHVFLGYSQKAQRLQTGEHVCWNGLQLVVTKAPGSLRRQASVVARRLSVYQGERLFQVLGCCSSWFIRAGQLHVGTKVLSMPAVGFIFRSGAIGSCVTMRADGTYSKYPLRQQRLHVSFTLWDVVLHMTFLIRVWGV